MQLGDTKHSKLGLQHLEAVSLTYILGATEFNQAPTYPNRGRDEVSTPANTP
jgi:hypothetical protein